MHVHASLRRRRNGGAAAVEPQQRDGGLTVVGPWTAATQGRCGGGAAARLEDLDDLAELPVSMATRACSEGLPASTKRERRRRVRVTEEARGSPGSDGGVGDNADEWRSSGLCSNGSRPCMHAASLAAARATEAGRRRDSGGVAGGP
jgi:hypothetical protein